MDDGITTGSRACPAGPGAAAADRTASAPARDGDGGESAGMVRGSVRRQIMAAQGEKCGTGDKGGLSRLGRLSADQERGCSVSRSAFDRNFQPNA
jgi:hypothetical protein